MNEKYKNASILFLRELFEQEDTESKKLKRKREISRSTDYDEEISYHEWHKKLIKYLIASTRSFNRNAALSAVREKRTEGKSEEELK